MQAAARRNDLEELNGLALKNTMSLYLPDELRELKRNLSAGLFKLLWESGMKINWFSLYESEQFLIYEKNLEFYKNIL